jgi:hypothetical protein
MPDDWGLEPIREDLPEPFRSNMIRWHEDLRVLWGFLKRYAPRGCERCGTRDHLTAFTPKTFRLLDKEILPALRIGDEDPVRDLLDGIGAELYCTRCARQVPKNGRWTDVQEARLQEISKEGQDERTD